MTIAPNRAVAVLTPLVFAPLAGSISVLVARYAPGVEVDSGAVEAIFIAGATIAFAKAGIWLKGWQDHERREEGVASGALDGDDLVDDDEELELDGDDLVDDDDEPDLEAATDDDLEPQPIAAGTEG